MDCKEKNIILTDSLIRNKAREIGLNLGFDEKRFKASSGWVENFKHRVGIRRGVWHGDGKKAKMIRAAAIGYYHMDDENETISSLPPPPPPPLAYSEQYHQREEAQQAPTRQEDHDGDYDFESDESETPAGCTEVYQQPASQSEWQDPHAPATSISTYHTMLRDDVIHEQAHSHGHMQHQSDVPLDNAPLSMHEDHMGEHMPILVQNGGTDHPDEEQMMYPPPILPNIYRPPEEIRDVHEAEVVLERLLRWLNAPANLELTTHPDRDAVLRIRTAVVQRINGIPPPSS